MKSVSRYHILCRTIKGEPVYLGDTVYIHNIGPAEVKYNENKLAVMFYTEIEPLYFSKVHGMITSVLLHKD